MPESLLPFHLAIPVKDIESTEKFYVKILGCSIGRRAERWIDFNFFSHQVSAHVTENRSGEAATNPVDGDDVPVRHFGIVMDRDNWQHLRERLEGMKQRFVVKPTIRFQGQSGEQATLFIQDPSGNCIEFKSLQDRENLFSND